VSAAPARSQIYNDPLEQTDLAVYRVELVAQMIEIVDA